MPRIIHRASFRAARPVNATTQALTRLLNVGLNAAPVLVGVDEWRRIAANAQRKPRIGV